MTYKPANQSEGVVVQKSRAAETSSHWRKNWSPIVKGIGASPHVKICKKFKRYFSAINLGRSWKSLRLKELLSVKLDHTW